MSAEKPPYDELQRRLEQAESALAALRRGEVDLVLGDGGPLLVRLKSLIDDNERLAQEWQTTFDAVGDAIFVLDAEQRVLRANRAAEAAFSCPRSEMIGKRCCEIVHGTAAPIPECPFHPMRTSRQRERLEMQLGERWFVLTTDPLLNEAGQLTGAVHIARDITEGKYAEAALAEGSQYLQAVLDSINDAVFVDDADTGEILDVNRGMCELYGYSREEALRVSIGELSLGEPPYSQAEALNWLRKTRELGPQTFEWVARHRDGHTFWVEVSTRFVVIAGHNRFVVIVRDISERKRAEERIRQSEETYRNLFHNAQVGLFRTRIEDGKILECNEQLARMFGYDSREEFIAEYVTSPNYVDPGTRERMVEMIRRDGFVAGFEARFFRKDRSMFWARFSARLYPEEGWIEGVAEDITAHKLAEQEKEALQSQLLQAQKMEAIGRLAGGVAHDFNNLLQAMTTAVYALRLRCPDAATAQATAELDRYIQRGADLTRQLLLSSRRALPQMQPCDINQVVRRAEGLLRRLLPENISVHTQLAQGEVWVDGDPAQVEQVLMNLAVNARDAMAEGGRLGLRTGQVGEGEVFIDVEDSGIGIPPELRERIFEPFFTTKDQGSGTGLGLAVVHGIVTQHGGRVEVESEPGHGSRFRVVLPRRQPGWEDRPAAEEAARTPQRGGGERVLVVEDEDGAREGLAEILALLGYQTTAVASAEQALTLPEGPPFQALLTDLMLPGVTGGRLAKTLMVRWPGLGVILMSGYPEDERVRHEMPSGVRFLQKPFDIDTLARALRATLDARRS